ncbi:MAG: PH domain-containing protein [Halobacteriales archaeon]
MTNTNDGTDTTSEGMVDDMNDDGPTDSIGEGVDTDTEPTDADSSGEKASGESVPTEEKRGIEETERKSTAGPVTKARGLPAVWSTLLGLPFVGGGAYVYLAETNVPSQAGIPILVFGLFVITLGTYIHFVAAPEPPTLRENEEIIDTRNPAQRAAAAKTVVGLFFLLGAGYLLFFTFRPYVYPTSTGFVGLYFFSTGLHAYWTNTLTTYYVTNQRLIKEYRFISLVRQELPFEKVRGVEERKSIWESIVGLGNVRVASGGGGALEIVIRNIYSPTAFADEIRNLV